VREAGFSVGEDDPRAIVGRDTATGSADGAYLGAGPQQRDVTANDTDPAANPTVSVLVTATAL
jgi:hypothetical protein